jgi:hypothetical protein
MARSRELVLALLAVVAVTAVYTGFVGAVGVPAASGLVGHSLGILGFGLMIMTETLYSLRKRAMRRPRGTRGSGSTSSPGSSAPTWSSSTPPGASTAWPAG